MPGDPLLEALSDAYTGSGDRGGEVSHLTLRRAMVAAYNSGASTATLTVGGTATGDVQATYTGVPVVGGAVTVGSVAYWIQTETGRGLVFGGGGVSGSAGSGIGSEPTFSALTLSDGRFVIQTPQDPGWNMLTINPTPNQLAPWNPPNQKQVPFLLRDPSGSTNLGAVFEIDDHTGAPLFTVMNEGGIASFDNIIFYRADMVTPGIAMKYASNSANTGMVLAFGGFTNQNTTFVDDTGTTVTLDPGHGCYIRATAQGHHAFSSSLLFERGNQQDVGSPFVAGRSTYMSTSYWLAGKTITYSTASPEGVITAPPGSVNMAETGSLYVKSTGTGNTGWVALGASGAADVDFEVFTQPGTLTVGTGKARLKFPFSVTLQTVGIAVDTAPTGASLIVDVNKNGTTVFTTQANRPTITASGFSSADMTPNTTAMATTDYLTIDIDQIGSTIAGADLTVFVKYTRP